jgi:iron complex transport system ATP-binding protein
MIRLSGVCCRLGGRPILHGVEVAVAAGEVVAIAGPNGAGKSTLLRCAAGLLTPETGEIRLDGRLLGSWPRRARARRLAYLPQRVSLSFAASAGEVVAWGRHPHRHPFTGADPRGAAVVADALARVEATALAERSFTTLSGGEQQRCLIAAALAQEARVLLLDEPSAGLDPPHAARLFRLLVELAEAGMAVAVVTHDLNLAACFAHRLVLLAGGKVVAAGIPAAVLTAAYLEAAYGEGLVVGRHPAHGGPVVLAAP